MFCQPQNRDEVAGRLTGERRLAFSITSRNLQCVSENQKSIFQEIIHGQTHRILSEMEGWPDKELLEHNPSTDVFYR